MNKKKKEQEKPKSFILKRESKIFSVPSVFFDNVPPVEAFNLATQTHIAQKKQLYYDAVNGNTMMVDGINAVEAMENALQKLKIRFPSLQAHLNRLDKSTDQRNIGKG